MLKAMTTRGESGESVSLAFLSLIVSLEKIKVMTLSTNKSIDFVKYSRDCIRSGLTSDIYVIWLTVNGHSLHVLLKTEKGQSVRFFGGTFSWMLSSEFRIWFCSHLQVHFIFILVVKVLLNLFNNNLLKVLSIFLVLLLNVLKC